MAQKWYAFKDASDKSGEVELFVYSDIGGSGIGAENFASELRKHKGKHVHLRINSLGGEVTEGNGIYNALSRHRGGVTVHIDGIAASMASVIAMAGTQVRMAENAILMIHNPWTMTAGESADLRKQADVLDMMKHGIVSAYQKKTGLEENVISAMMDEEKWLKAEEAVELGFADVIEEGFEAAASLSEWKSRFDKFARHMGENIPAEKNEAEAVAAVEPVTEIAPAVEPVAEAFESVTESPVAEEAKAEEALATEEVKAEESVAESPQAKADHEFTAVLLKVTAERDVLTKRAETAETELAAAKLELSRLNSELSAKGLLYDVLKRSLGISEAATVPTVATEDKSDPVSQWMDAVERKDYAAAGELYAKHKRAIWAAREKLSKATS